MGGHKPSPGRGSRPDEPYNRTGWRIDFPWLPDGECIPKPGATKRKPGRRKSRGNGGLRHRNRRGGETKTSPRGGDTFDREGETVSSPNYAGASKRNSDGLNPKGFSSSSSLLEAPETRETESKADDDEIPTRPETGNGETAEASIRFARRRFGQTAAEAVEADVRRIGRRIGSRWEFLTAAVAVSALKKEPPANLLSYLWTVLTDFLEDGEVPVKAKVAVVEFRAQDRIEDERARRAEAEAEASRRLDAMTAAQLVEEIEGRGHPLRMRADGSVEIGGFVPELVPLRDRMKPLKAEIVAILRGREVAVVENLRRDGSEPSSLGCSRSTT